MRLLFSRKRTPSTEATLARLMAGGVPSKAPRQLEKAPRDEGGAAGGPPPKKAKKAKKPEGAAGEGGAAGSAPKKPKKS